MTRRVTVLPARGSREELIGRSVKEGPVAWGGRTSSRARSGPRPDGRNFAAQGKAGWIFTNGGGETLVWSDSNRLLGRLAVVDVHPKVG